MKTTLVLLLGLTALSSLAQTNNPPAGRRRGGGGGGNGPGWPPATNAISWSGLSFNAHGELVAKIVVDTTDASDLAPWGRHAGELCATWYPKIAELLGVDGFLLDSRTNITLAERDIINLESLAGKLKQPADGLSTYLAKQLSSPTKKLLDAYKSGPDAALREALAGDLNRVAKGGVIYDKKRFAAAKLSPDVKKLLDHKVPKSETASVNLLLLSEAYPTEIRDSSLRTIKLWFRKDMPGVANTSPPEGLIRISSAYVLNHTNDWGMVIHELVHTVQSFGGRGGAGSLPTVLTAEDIKDAPALAARLKAHTDPVAQSVWERLTDPARESVKAYGTNDDVKPLAALLLKELNSLVQTNALEEDLRREDIQFAGVQLSRQAKGLLVQDLPAEKLAQFNRLFLLDAFAKELGASRGRGNGAPTWLTEGVADYVRLGHYEPDAPLPRRETDKIASGKASYTDSYKTTATFFRWIEKAHDPGFVKKINLALREGKYQPGLFKEYTGRTMDELWEEFVAAMKANPHVV